MSIIDFSGFKGLFSACFSCIFPLSFGFFLPLFVQIAHCFFLETRGLSGKKNFRQKIDKIFSFFPHIYLKLGTFLLTHGASPLALFAWQPLLTSSVWRSHAAMHSRHASCPHSITARAMPSYPHRLSCGG